MERFPRECGLDCDFFNADWDEWLSCNIWGTKITSYGVDWPRFFPTTLWAIWHLRNDWIFSIVELNTTKIQGIIRSMGMEQQLQGL